MPVQSFICPPLPRYYVIDTGNVCNLHCPFCPTGKRQKGMATGLMTLETYETILSKIGSQAFFFEMINWGEPFLNRHFVKMVALAAQMGIRVHADSNLTSRQFSDEEAEAIVRSGLWMLRATVSGASQEAYERYHRGGDFGRALQNLVQVQRAKERLGSSTPLVHWKFLVSGGNVHEIERAKKLARALGITVFFRPMEVCSHRELRTWMHDLQGAGKFVPDEWFFAAPCALNESPLFFKPKPELAHYKVVSPRLSPEVPRPCFQPFARMTVNWDGRVLPCCNCYGDHFYVGDLVKQSLEDVWFGPALQATRHFLLNFGPKQSTGSVCETGDCPLRNKHRNILRSSVDLLQRFRQPVEDNGAQNVENK